MGTKLIFLVIFYYLFQNLVLRFKLSINRISIGIHFELFGKLSQILFSSGFVLEPYYWTTCIPLYGDFLLFFIKQENYRGGSFDENQKIVIQSKSYRVFPIVFIFFIYVRYQYYLFIKSALNLYSKVHDRTK